MHPEERAKLSRRLLQDGKLEEAGIFPQKAEISPCGRTKRVGAGGRFVGAR